MKKTTTMAAAMTATLCLAGTVQPASAQIPGIPDIKDLDKKALEIGKEALKGAAIGYAVKQSAGPLNQFINAVTLRNGLKDTQTTKVVPILSVGNKGYIGGAQISGPAELIGKTQAVWQVEGEKMIGDGVYRAKALIPSNSLNPLHISRVQKVGVTAIIDVATGGPLSKEGPNSRPLRGGDLIKTGAIAVAVNAAAGQINSFVNSITFNKSSQGTKVVPMATLGEKAYIGAGQLSGSANTLPGAKALWQYEDLFDRGRFRVKILVPTNLDNPTKLRRIPGVGLTALIDTSIQRQANTLEKKPAPVVVAARPVPVAVNAPPHAGPVNPVDISRLPPGQRKKLGLGPHDNGKHKGWYKDKSRENDDEQDDHGKHDKKEKHGHGKGHDD